MWYNNYARNERSRACRPSLWRHVEGLSFYLRLFLFLFCCQCLWSVIASGLPCRLLERNEDVLMSNSMGAGPLQKKTLFVFFFSLFFVKHCRLTLETTRGWTDLNHGQHPFFCSTCYPSRKFYGKFSCDVMCLSLWELTRMKVWYASWLVGWLIDWSVAYLICRQFIESFVSNVAVSWQTSS